MNNADAAKDRESFSDVLIKLSERRSVDLVTELRDPDHVTFLILDGETKDIPEKYLITTNLFR